MGMNPGFGPLKGNHQLDGLSRGHSNSHSLHGAPTSFVSRARGDDMIFFVLGSAPQRVEKIGDHKPRAVSAVGVLVFLWDGGRCGGCWPL